MGCCPAKYAAVPATPLRERHFYDENSELIETVERPDGIVLLECRSDHAGAVSVYIFREDGTKFAGCFLRRRQIVLYDARENRAFSAEELPAALLEGIERLKACPDLDLRVLRLFTAPPSRPQEAYEILMQIASEVA